MPEDQLKAFWEAIQADAGLQQKLQGVTEPDAIVLIAQEAGFTISAEEIKEAQSELECTDEQLGGVRGGVQPGSRWNAPSISSVICC
jgi:predicted ribosomally synthesized peptide with nif11-like leader